MPMKHGFNPDQPLPLFLADRNKEPDLGKDSDPAVSRSRAVRASILVATATALGIAVFSMGNPVMLFANLTASLVDKSSPQPGTDQVTPTIQAAADTQALPPAAADALAGAEVAAAEPAGQEQAKTGEASPETLFSQFQAWAAGQDAQAQVEPAQSDAPAQSVQDAPAQVEQDAPAQGAQEPLRLMQKQRRPEHAGDARAEMLRQNSRKMIRRSQNARRRASPARDAGVQDQPVQNAGQPSLLQGFGLHN